MICTSVIYMFVNHTELAATKNEHLHNELIKKIESKSDIIEIKSKYIEILGNSRTVKTIHNEETKLFIYILLVSLLLVIINTWLVVTLNRSSSDNT